MAYDKMNDYIESIYNVFRMIHKKALEREDKKTKYISLIIYNYVSNLAKEYNINLKSNEDPTSINLIPFFEYVTYNNIEFYDFSKIELTDVDVTKKEDIERFVLSHVYYLTQQS